MIQIRTSVFEIPSRLVIDGEQLVVYKFRPGLVRLASVADVRRHEKAVKSAPKGSLWPRLRRFITEDGSHSIPSVCVPSGTHLILREIPVSIRQRYGLTEEEGAVFVETNSEVGSYRDALRFNNGAQIQVQELRVGQLIEVLSLAGTRAMLYEREFQMQ